jgi:uncharacterized protein
MSQPTHWKPPEPEARESEAQVRDPFQMAGRIAAQKGLPPVHLWNPPFCGDIDMRIAADGTWFYQGSPIGRPAMVRLFSTILRRDPDRFVLVTPVERVGILVDDAPFLAVAMERQHDATGQQLLFRTNVGDEVIADKAHPLRFEPDAHGGLRPYVLVRGGLWAKLNRAVALDLMSCAEIEDGACGVRSGGAFFRMGDAGLLSDTGSW